MATLSLKPLASIFVFSVVLMACNSSEKVFITPLKTAITSSDNHVLVITKVKKPWYAWRGLVAGKMEESIPEYQAIHGLSKKFYSFTANHNYFGGIYLWKEKTDAEKWFNPTWFERTEKKYGKKGEVLYYTIEKVTEYATPNQPKGRFWAVISDENSVNSEAKGLLTLLSLKDAQNKSCFLSIWQNEDSAKNYFKDSKQIHEEFDIPLIITCSK
ncbi:hypothetical protein AD998_16145 [bacterium 336/3]|nr:hypothetical protein AD998_16145 [bacterium 336/3]